jgi:hypothetical protein
MLVSTEAFRLQALRLDALVFLRVLLESQDSTQMRKHIPSLVGLVQTAMNGDWYKIIAEAVRVAGIIVSVWRPSNSIMSPAANANIDGAAMIVSIYSALLPKLEALDIDQEIKECAVIVCGKMFAHVGDVLSNQLPHVLSLLQKRLENEILRIATLRTLAMIANSSLNLDMSNNINALLSDVSVFLRQQNRNLKVTSLNALSALLLSASSASSAQPAVVDAVFREVNAVIDDSDLNITALAVKLSGDVFAHRPEFRTAIAQQVYPTLLKQCRNYICHEVSSDARVVVQARIDKQKRSLSDLEVRKRNILHQCHCGLSELLLPGGNENLGLRAGYRLRTASRLGTVAALLVGQRSAHCESYTRDHSPQTKTRTTGLVVGACIASLGRSGICLVSRTRFLGRVQKHWDNLFAM